LSREPILGYSPAEGLQLQRPWVYGDAHTGRLPHD
jgi:hypothetical protein